MLLSHVLSATLLLATPADWTIAPAVTVGQNGFTQILAVVVGDAGTMAVWGERGDFERGIYVVAGSNVAAVALEGADQPLGGVGRGSGLGEPRVDPFGRILFGALVTLDADGNNVEARSFRWEAGVLTRILTEPGFSHNFSGTPLASDGRWIAVRTTGPLSSQTMELILTDGTNHTPIVAFTPAHADDVLAAPFRVNAAGVLAVRHTLADPPPPPPNRVLTLTSQLRLYRAGETTPTIAVQDVTPEDLTTFPGSANGSFLALAGFNDAGSLLYARDTYAGAFTAGFTRDLVLLDSAGEGVLVSVRDDDSITSPRLKPVGLDHAGRVAFTIRRDDAEALDFYSGPDLDADRVIGVGDMLFGKVVVALSDFAQSGPAAGLGDARIFVFRYELADGTQGFATATRSGVHWLNPAGGAWTGEDNWFPTGVPGATTATIFDVEASYDVTVGPRTAGRVAIENGSVAFRSADLTLTGPLVIGGDATFTQAEGRITAGELTIGSLPPADPANEPTARFVLSNNGTEFNTTGPTVIGHAGIGDLFITDAQMTSGEVRIGDGSEGSAAIGLPNASWTTGNVAIGLSHAGTLTIERGAVVSSEDVVIGAGTELKEALGAVIIDNADGPADVTHWFVDELTIGTKLPGRLALRHGGVALVSGDAQLATDFHGEIFDAHVEISGVRGPENTSSQLSVFGDMLVGMAEDTTSRVEVTDGGRLSLNADLNLAHEAGSRAQLAVSGVNANETPSHVHHGSSSNSETIIVGRAGLGLFSVRDGGFVSAAGILLGGVEATSQGELFVRGSARGQAAEVEVRNTLVVGGTPLAGTNAAARGVLTVGSGCRVDANVIAVSATGRVRGSGTVASGTTFNLGGVIEPGVFLEPSLAEIEPNRVTGPVIARAEAPTAPGELTLAGNVALDADARIELDVLGSAPGAADRLVINGALALNGGTLVLNFGNGYAPKQGDTLDLIVASSVSGSFANTTIAGLAPGFQFEIAPPGNGGSGSGSAGLRLTALDDGVPATSVGSRLANLSVRTALADAQTVIVGFVMHGVAKPLLVRGAGPGLAPFIGGAHADPRITLFDDARVEIDANDNWSADLAPTMAALGAFAFAPGSADAALLREFDGLHTAHVNGPGSGIVLVELYDALAETSSRLINISARNHVGTGDDILIAGFVIDGTAPKAVLIRGVGPGLTRFDVANVLADPQLTLFDATRAPIAENDDWPAGLAATFDAVSAFALADGSKDAALLVTLAPGLYTAQVRGAGGTTGEALVEIYEVP